MLRSENGGQDLPLSGRIVTFGSSQDCGLHLAGKGIPDRMGHFLFREGRYHLQAISRRDLIRVNGREAAESMPLSQGDLLEIGAARFRYLDGPEEERIAALADNHDQKEAAVHSEQAPLGEIVRAMTELLRDKGSDIFLPLVSGVSHLLRCDAARVVEENPDTGERRTIARYPVHAGMDRFSKRAIDWAKTSDKTVLTQEADWEESNSINSLRTNRVSSVLCVALREAGGIVGYLYMDRMDGAHPFNENDRALCDVLSDLFVEVLAHRRDMERQKATISRLQCASLEEKGGILYAEPQMADLMILAERIANTDAAVLIRGETGTGKDLLARFLHSHSTRAGKPFLSIHCSAIPPELIEIELFGQVRDPATGRDRLKSGLLRAADGGTLFLDEIGELPLDIQGKLLRVFQESEFTPVGASEPIRVDVRILSATHCELGREAREGRFRQDLYFRLTALELALPPLRERGQDVLLLADYFLQKGLQQFGLPSKSLSLSACKRLQNYPFPGNVRELENLIQKAILLTHSKHIGAEELQLEDVDLVAWATENPQA